MAVAIKGYAESMAMDIQNYFFRNTAWTVVATFHCALYNVVVLSDGTGGTECSGNAYERVPCTQGIVNWTAAAVGTVHNAEIYTENAENIQFPDAGPDGWTDGNGAGLHPAMVPTDVNLNDVTVGGSFGTSKPIPVGVSPIFVAGNFKVSTYNSAP